MVALRACKLHVGVADWRVILFTCNQRVGDFVIEPLRAAVTNVQNALSSQAVVNRESDANQRHVELASEPVALAVADDQIRLTLVSQFGDFAEIGAFDCYDLSWHLSRHLRYRRPEPSALTARGTHDRHDADLREEPA